MNIYLADSTATNHRLAKAGTDTIRKPYKFLISYYYFKRGNVAETMFKISRNHVQD